MPIKSYNPAPIAREIINIFAKYEIPINFKDSVYKAVDDMLRFQIVAPIEVTALDRENSLLKQSQPD